MKAEKIGLEASDAHGQFSITPQDILRKLPGNLRGNKGVREEREGAGHNFGGIDLLSEPRKKRERERRHREDNRHVDLLPVCAHR